MSDRVCGVHATDGVRHHDCPYCHQIEIAEKDAEIERLTRERDECRRLLRELLAIADHDMSTQFHSDVMDAARKAAGGDDE